MRFQDSNGHNWLLRAWIMILSWVFVMAVETFDYQDCKKWIDFIIRLLGGSGNFDYSECKQWFYHVFSWWQWKCLIIQSMENNFTMDFSDSSVSFNYSDYKNWIEFILHFPDSRGNSFLYPSDKHLIFSCSCLNKMSIIGKIKSLQRYWNML